MGRALRDNLKTGNDFPANRERGSLAEHGPRRLTGPDHHHLAEKPVRCARRQGIDDEFQRGFVRHMAVTLTVDVFGLDTQLSGFGEKVHSARGLHATVGAVAKFFRCMKRIAVFNSQASPAFSGNQYPASGFLCMSRTSPFPQSKRDVVSMSMASP